MKLKKIIGFIFLLILPIIANALSVTSYGVTPSTIKVGESYRFYINLDSNLPSGYDIRLSASSSKGSRAEKMKGGQKNWYASGVANTARTATLYFHLYKNGVDQGYLSRKATLTVKQAPPTLSGGVYIASITGGLKINSRSASGEDRYEFYRSTRNGSLGSRIHSGSSRYYSDTSGLVNNTAYYYTIKACNSSGCATSGQNYYRYTAPVPTLSGGVNIVSVTGGFRVNSQSASRQDRYEFYRSTRSGSLGSRIYSGNSRYHTDTNGLVYNTTYYYTIKACNSYGCATSNQDRHLYTTPTPNVSSFTTSPSSPRKFASITFTAKTNIAASNVKFKCGTGSWKNHSAVSNGNKTWSYTRSVGLKENTTCSVDIDGNGTSDEDLSMSLQSPTFETSNSNTSPTVGEEVEFYVITDTIENGYTVQVKYSSVWNSMTTSNRRNWNHPRIFNSAGAKTISYRIIRNSDEKIFHTATTTLSVSKAPTPNVSSFTASPSSPRKFASITFTAKTNIAASNVKFKCGSGSWQNHSAVSNGNKTWSYTRSVGLKENTTCYVDIDSNGTSDKDLSMSLQSPTFETSNSNATPTVGEQVQFYVITDTIENSYTVQIKYSSIWNSMTTSNRRNWNHPRIFSSSGAKTISYRIIRNSDEKIFHTATTALTVGKESVSTIISFLNKAPLIATMSLNSHQENDLSRSDAIVMIDRMRALLKSNIDKNMQDYYNPFADVPEDADYLSSLMRLAYYKSNFGQTVIEKDQLFNPMRHMMREEFIKVAMNGFDIPQKSQSLSAFSDKANIASWAEKYFQTAVYYGVLVGNDGKLLPKEKISIKDALRILRRIKDKFSANYPFDSNGYETSESLGLSQLYTKTIGYEYEPRYYKPDATPIDITSISKNKTGNYYVLTVSSTIDSSNGASGYYWWNTDKGYFKQANNDGQYKTIHFYPMSSKPISDYHITVNGGDNLGYVDQHSVTIDKNNFSYLEDNHVAGSIQASLNNIQFDQELVANELFTIDLSGVSVKKSNLELSLDQATVTMIVGNEEYKLFHGTPNNQKIRFVMGDYAEFYGKDVTLNVELYSQAKKLATPKSYSVKYTPQFIVRGRVYNAASGTKVTSIVIGGQDVTLDEDNEFYYKHNGTNAINGLEIKAAQNSEENHFDSTTIDLSYESPNRYVVLTGEDVRPSLNLTVSPIHVPSGELITFKLTADENIPSNATIDLEDSFCIPTVTGLGSRIVEIQCHLPETDDVKHILMNISSPDLYDNGLARTITVDRSLNVIDKDGDGVEDKNDAFPDNPNESIDTDNDGIGNNADTDDDGDSLPDTWEIANGLDPLDATDAAKDRDGDGLSNLDEFINSTSPNKDIIKPIITVPTNTVLKAKRFKTKFALSSLGTISVEDAIDGSLIPVLSKVNGKPALLRNNKTQLLLGTGKNVLIWTATDKAGNTAEAEQIVAVLPRANFAVNQSSNEGAELNVTVSLNGAAPAYPVVIPFTLSGNAEQGENFDYTLPSDSNEIIITEPEFGRRPEGSITVTLLDDGVAENTENIVFTLADILTQATLGNTRQHRITILVDNLPPKARIQVMQAGKKGKRVYQDNGVVTLTVKAKDPNNDSLAYVWGDNILDLNNDSNPATLEFDPLQLNEGMYETAVTVSDGVHSIEVEKRIKVKVGMPVIPDAALDTDGDGIQDIDERGDENENGIADYLEDMNQGSHQLSMTGDNPLETTAGLSFELGDFAQNREDPSSSQISEDDIKNYLNSTGRPAYQADVSHTPTVLLDYVLNGLENVGESAQIVFSVSPLTTTDVIRKYSLDNGWQAFIVTDDGKNVIESLISSDGNCANDESVVYQTGLVKNADCVRLTIEDGGSNDADGKANGAIEDPVSVSTDLGRLNIEQFVTRFYQQGLLREPDSGGLKNWSDGLNAGTLKGSDVANSFIFSQEFINRQVSNTEFVNILYRAFFNREADTGGFNAWVNGLASGMSRQEVLDGFLGAEEFFNLCDNYSITCANTKSDSGSLVEQFVTRFYQQGLLREPDAGGLKNWSDGLNAGTLKGSDVANSFIFSQEFINRQVSNIDFVNILYRAFFNREADTGGFNGWFNGLESGMSRQQVLDGFLGAQEFFNLCDEYGISPN